MKHSDSQEKPSSDINAPPAPALPTPEDFKQKMLEVMKNSPSKTNARAVNKFCQSLLLLLREPIKREAGLTYKDYQEKLCALAVLFTDFVYESKYRETLNRKIVFNACKNSPEDNMLLNKVVKMIRERLQKDFDFDFSGTNLFDPHRKQQILGFLEKMDATKKSKMDMLQALILCLVHSEMTYEDFNFIIKVLAITRYQKPVKLFVSGAGIKIEPFISELEAVLKMQPTVLDNTVVMLGQAKAQKEDLDTVIKNLETEKQHSQKLQTDLNKLKIEKKDTQFYIDELNDEITTLQHHLEESQKKAQTLEQYWPEKNKRDIQHTRNEIKLYLEHDLTELNLSLANDTPNIKTLKEITKNITTYLEGLA